MAGAAGNSRTISPSLMSGLSNGLIRLSDEYPDLSVRLTRTAGLDQLTLPTVPADKVLTRYYETRR